MRCHVLTSASLAILGLSAEAAVVRVAEERPLDAGQALHLRLEAGSLEVRPGEAGKVGLEATLAPGQRVIWRESVDRRVLIVDDPERLSPRRSELRVAVPAGAPLVIHLGGASLDLQGAESPRLVVRGGSGARIAGAFDAADVRVDGALDLQLEGPTGDVRAEGREVEVVAQGAIGSVAVDAVGGPSTLALDRPRRVRATSVSGAITLRLGSASGADVVLESLSGDLRVDVVGAWPRAIVPQLATGDLSLPAAETPRVAAGAAVGEGGRLVLRSFSGDARVESVAPPAGEPGPAPGRN